MSNSLQEKIDFVMLPEICNEDVQQILNWLGKINSEDIAFEYRKAAELFCLCIKKIDSKNGGNFIDCVESAFDNIQRLGKGALDEDANVMVVKFLSRLKDFTFEAGQPCVDLENDFKKLCDNLEQMHVIFQLKKNDEYLFPIGKLLNLVIESDYFLSKKYLDDVSFSTMLLALEIFDESSYKAEYDRVQEIIKRYHLECLNYICRSDALKVGGENDWKENLKRNGVLTILVPNKNGYELFIRHSEKRYFETKEACIDLKEEKNSKNQIIAYYCIIPQESVTVCENIDKIFIEKNLSLQKQLCTLLFTEKKFNIFTDNSLIIENGCLKTTNPFVQKDSVVILEKGKNCKANANNVFDEALKPYYNIVIGDNLDIVLFCSIFDLLKRDAKNIEKIFSILDKKEKDLQSNIIEAWANGLDNFIEKILLLKSDYFRNIAYAKKKDDYVNKTFHDVIWFPFIFPLTMIEEKLQEEKKKLSSDELLLNVKKNNDYDSEEYTDEKNNIVQFEEDFLKKERLTEKESFYVIQNKKTGKHIFNREIDSLINLIEKIKEENKGLYSASVLNFDKIQMSFVFSLMQLQKKALCGANIVGKANFESVAKIRLLNHLVANRIISKDKWDIFYSLLQKHGVLKFNNARNKIDFDEEGTLIVPKESSNSDNVLVSVFNNYVRQDDCRNRDVFNRQISYSTKKGYYLENGVMIEKIILWFDTIQSGSSTCDVLRTYFNLGGVKSAKEVCHFFCKIENNENDRNYKFEERSIVDIAKQNNAKLNIISFYASEKGAETVRTFLEENDFKEIETKFIDNINAIADEKFVEQEMFLYGKHDFSIKIGDYPIIREFNQPKKNVFPKNQLDPSNIVSIFVKKPEMYTKY